jgi:DNA polymerase III delta prime subunit
MINHYHQLWVEKYRPQTLDDILLSDDVKQHFLNINSDTPHILFYGSPGTGKSTLSKIIVKSILKCQYLYINASDENGVDTIRNKVISFAQTRSIDANKKVVILEEADGLTGESLKILRNVMEEYEATTRFVLTANYFNKIIEPIRSRCLLFKLQPEIKDVVQRCADILKAEKIIVEEKQRYQLLTLIEKNYPDLRRIINDLQKFSISGKLSISENNHTFDTAQTLLKMLESKISSLDIRKKTIESEKIFGADYQQLMKEMFEVIYSSTYKDALKKVLLLELGEHMFRDNSVVDHEINFFCCIMALEQHFKT